MYKGHALGYGTNELRPLGTNMGLLAGPWNVAKHCMKDRRKRREHARGIMRANLLCSPAGKGNKAWKRYNAIFNNPSLLVWPDYLR